MLIRIFSTTFEGPEDYFECIFSLLLPKWFYTLQLSENFTPQSQKFYSFHFGLGRKARVIEFIEILGVKVTTTVLVTAPTIMFEDPGKLAPYRAKKSYQLLQARCIVWPVPIKVKSTLGVTTTKVN